MMHLVTLTGIRALCSGQPATPHCGAWTWRCPLAASQTSLAWAPTLSQ